MIQKILVENFDSRDHYETYGGTTRTPFGVVDAMKLVINTGMGMGIETSFDLMSMPREDLYSVSELFPSAGFIMVRPVNTHMAYSTLTMARAKSTASREIKIPDRFDRYGGLDLDVPAFDKVFFLPGSNILMKHFPTPDPLIGLAECGWVFKMHPLTMSEIRKELIDLLGADKVMYKGGRASSLFKKARKVGCCNNSEIGLTAILKGKEMSLQGTQPPQGGYYPLYALVKQDLPAAKQIIESLAGNWESGIFHKDDPDLQEKVIAYYEHQKSLWAFS